MVGLQYFYGWCWNLAQNVCYVSNPRTFDTASFRHIFLCIEHFFTPLDIWAGTSRREVVEAAECVLKGLNII